MTLVYVHGFCGEPIARRQPTPTGEISEVRHLFHHDWYQPPPSEPLLYFCPRCLDVVGLSFFCLTPLQ